MIVIVPDWIISNYFLLRNSIPDREISRQIPKQNRFHRHLGCEIALEVYHNQSLFPKPMIKTVNLIK